LKDDHLSMVGYILGVAPTMEIERFRLMDIEELQFRYFWVKEVERDRMLQLGKMIGATFTAGDIRKWSLQNAGTPDYKKDDMVFLPLALALRPELRDMLIKMVGGDGGLAMPRDYQGQRNEVMVDLGKVSHQEFLDFVQKKILPRSKSQAEED